jgi:hypothetical protein
VISSGSLFGKISVAGADQAGQIGGGHLRDRESAVRIHAADDHGEAQILGNGGVSDEVTGDSIAVIENYIIEGRLDLAAIAPTELTTSNPRMINSRETLNMALVLLAATVHIQRDQTYPHIAE